MAAPENIHEEIEAWLAAAVHDQLSNEERAALQEHLSGCANCRALHQEETAMTKMIESTFAELRPDLGFEQRVLAKFRRSIPSRDGIASPLVRLWRSRILWLSAAALLLLATGVYLTGMGFAFLGSGDAMLEGGLRNDHSFHALVARLSWAERKAEMASESRAQRITDYRTFPATPAEGLRRLPSSIGSAQIVRNGADKDSKNDKTGERVVTGSYIPTAEGEEKLPVTVYGAKAASKQGSAALAPPANAPAEQAYGVEGPGPTPAGQVISSAPDSNRKLIRKAQVELEVVKFDEAVQKITALVTEGKGYVATSSSEKQENGKLRGQVVVKVLPESLDSFLAALRGVGEVKNQTLGTDDVSKKYFDTDSRLKNARIMEQRLVEMLQKSTGKVSDLLQVEKELGRVREEIETMQGELKYLDAQVQFATVTITLSEKDMDVPAAFLLKRHADLALFSSEVEKTFAEIKGVIDGAKAQISSSALDHNNAGEVTARLTLLIVADEADATIARIKEMGRVQSYNEKTERIAQGGSGMSDTAKVERAKVELSLTVSRNAQEPALQTTSLSILTGNVNEKVARLKENALKLGAEVRSSTFNGSSNGSEQASITLRVPMKDYATLIKSFDQLGTVKDVNVRREDRGGALNEATAPAEINATVYNEPNIVSDESGLSATIRSTLTQGALALMWSLRMIGVALAFLAPWIIALLLARWIWKRISRRRRIAQKVRDAG